MRRAVHALTPAGIEHACDDLTRLLTNAHAVLDRRDHRRPLAHSGLEETSAGSCYESEAA